MQKTREQHTEEKNSGTEVFTELQETIKAIQESMVSVKETVKGFTEVQNTVKELQESMVSLNETVEKVCPPDFIRLPVGCYYFSGDVTKTYADARADCKRRSGDLVAIESHLENSYIKKQLTMNGNKNAHWISLTRSDGVWRWFGAESGPAAQYTDWYSGHPKSTSTYNCALTIAREPWDWQTYHCDNGNLDPYICEA